MVYVCVLISGVALTFAFDLGLVCICVRFLVSLIGSHKNVIDLVDPVPLEALAHIFGNVRCYLDTIYGTLNYSFISKNAPFFL